MTVEMIKYYLWISTIQCILFNDFCKIFYKCLR